MIMSIIPTMKFLSSISILFITILFSHTPYAYSAQSKINNFHWSASLDLSNGLSNARETSSQIIQIRSSTQSSNHNNSSEEEVSKCIESIFASYPNWLVKKGVTFGLFTVKSGQILLAHEMKEVRTSDLCIRLLGTKLLRFGIEQTYTTRRWDEKKTVTKLPILGGLLSCNNQSQGYLQFECKKSANFFHLETQIVDYRPTIAGLPPVNPFRKFLYLHSQSIVHAYVMNRFHRYCYEQIALKYKTR